MAKANRWLVVLLAGLMQFAQLALAAQGCVVALDRAPDAHDPAMVEEQCGSLPMEGGVCVVHCLGIDQSSSAPDYHFTAIALSPAVQPLDFALSANRAPCRQLSDSRLHVPLTPQILFCSYQT